MAGEENLKLIGILGVTSLELRVSGIFFFLF